MEFGSFKLDLNALAMLITAVTTAYATWRGLKARIDKRHKIDPRNADAKKEDKDGTDAE